MLIDYLNNNHSEILKEYLEKHSSLIILLLDKELKIIDCNQRFLKVTNQNQKPTGTPLINYLHEESTDALNYSLRDSSGNIKLILWEQGENLHMIEGHYFFIGDKYIILGEMSHLSDSDIIQEFSVLNNELTNMIRELNKKNHELKKANDTINRLSRVDPLTNLYNRRFFMETIEKAFSQFKRKHIPFSLVMSDLDDFKAINDQWGHNVGDKVLIEFSKLLENNSRKEDTPARIGGEEFIILLPDTTYDYAEKYAQRTRKAFNELSIPPLNTFLTASFGITQLQHSDNADIAMSRVDKALYRAKEKGKNRVECIPS